jgi:RNA polymerase-binding transcription factor DksA
MPALPKETVEKLRGLLEKNKRAVLKDLEDLKKVPNMGDDVDSFEEKADEVEEFTADRGMAESVKERLVRIEEAERKIAAGRYGICENCHKMIEEEVLTAAPESEYCRSCKLRMR